MFGEKTGAFIASRVLSEVTGSWFDSSWDEKEQIYRISGATLKNALDARLAGLKQKSGTGTMLKGSMTKEFPSTLAAAIVQPGGSIRDDEAIAKADELGVVMLFTGVRHFKH